MISLLLGKWKLILGAVVVVGVFLAGWTTNGWRWKAKVADGERKAEVVRLAKEKKATAIFTKEAKVEKKIVYRTKIIYKEIARTTGDAKCIDDPELRFIAIWNKAASKTDTDSVQ